MTRRLKAFGTSCGEVVLTEHPTRPRYTVHVYRLERRPDGLTNQKLCAAFTTNTLSEAIHAYQHVVENLSNYL